MRLWSMPDFSEKCIEHMRLLPLARELKKSDDGLLFFWELRAHHTHSHRMYTPSRQGREPTVSLFFSSLSSLLFSSSFPLSIYRSGPWIPLSRRFSSLGPSSRFFSTRGAFWRFFYDLTPAVEGFFLRFFFFTSFLSLQEWAVSRRAQIAALADSVSAVLDSCSND